MKLFGKKSQVRPGTLEGFCHAGGFSVLYADGIFRVFYPVPTVYGGYIACAESTDGNNWSAIKKVVVGTDATSCTAIRKNGKTFLFYAERGALRLAVGGRDGEFDKFPGAIISSGIPKGIRLTVADGKKYLFTDGKKGKLDCYVSDDSFDFVKRKLEIKGLNGKIYDPNFYGIGQKTRLVYSDGKTTKEVEGRLDLSSMVFEVESSSGESDADCVRTAFVSDGKFMRFERYGGELSGIEAHIVADGARYFSEIERSENVTPEGAINYSVCNGSVVLPDSVGATAYRFRLYGEDGKAGVRVRFTGGTESYINYDFFNKVVTVKGVSDTGKPIMHSCPLVGDAEFYAEIGGVIRYVSNDGSFTRAFRTPPIKGASVCVYSDTERRFDAEVYKIKQKEQI